ncbi:hypothetical protein [Methylobacterium nonmethylotrophicum]|uniref:Uncharacterized protein n=1 Tax=Methylobacterium nonmethylotrophicum TaxID=1141884 RepID=A0A4Z0NQS1_9HYPH|nr:hypothetical protein [Methylobacterium nonmethylotrophicum]TGD99071.1 hypothetical protein EU555_14315 [Methylobacterium nonmethylotrophicum]
MTTARRRSNPPLQPVGLPGSKPGRADMHHYTVVFKGSAAKENTGKEAAGRAAFVNERVRKTANDLESLRALVTREHLQGELGGFGEPTAFGMVELVATPRLAARIERAARVKAVIAE